MIQNFIRIKGDYVAQEDIAADQMKEISATLAVRLAEGFGYVPVNPQQFDCVTEK